MNTPLVEGGQGRSDESVEADGMLYLWLVIIAAVACGIGAIL